MNRFGMPARACRFLTCAIVPAVSFASSGETSSDTQPSRPRVASKLGRNSAAARFRSSSARVKKIAWSSPSSRRAPRRIVSSYSGVWRIALSKIVGLDVSPVSAKSRT